MHGLDAAQRTALDDLASRLGATGAQLALEVPGEPPLRVGPAPPRARVRFQRPEDALALLRGDHRGLAEAYLAGRIEVEGELAEVLRVVETLDLEPSAWQRLRFGARLLLGDRRRLRRESIAFHYDRPPDFFLPWFDRWRSYTHGLYAAPDEDLETATERKLRAAVAALRLEPGMRVLDVGAGWGPFVEYAGARGIRVEAITNSRVQHAFLEQLVRERMLPCTATLVDFFDYEPAGRFDAAVFMGSLEHLIDYPRVARRLARQLVPGGRVWADFCAQRARFQVGDFLRTYVWPGTATYVDTAALVGALVRAGFNVHELADDTLSYACTVRDWARRLEAIRDEHAAKWGEPAVRTLLLFLWGSHRFLATNRTQAYHLVAALAPRELDASAAA